MLLAAPQLSAAAGRMPPAVVASGPQTARDIVVNQPSARSVRYPAARTHNNLCLSCCDVMTDVLCYAWIHKAVARPTVLCHGSSKATTSP